MIKYVKKWHKWSKVVICFFEYLFSPACFYSFILLYKMAKQAGILKITGCISGTCFYRLEGEYYARQKSSLSGKRVKNDPAFKKTMFYASLLAKASVIGSAVYRSISKEKRNRALYQKITGVAMKMLKEESNETTVQEELKKSFTTPKRESRYIKENTDW